MSATDSCTISRRSDVQRWPQVPTAANRIARTARSRSALGVTIIALLPPSSSSERPRRAATFGAIARPIAVDPVADTSGTRGSSTSARPALPTITSTSPSGASPKRSSARRNSAWQASAVSGVREDGFQITGSPHTSASAAFQLQTATGKLNAVMMPTGPSGSQVSIIRCPGRSDAIVRPYSCRDSPTAKSQMSIISCTSPRPSWPILPASRVTSAPSASFSWRSSSASRRTSSPRRGAGTSRQTRNASTDRAIAASASASLVEWRFAITSPVMGVRTSRSPPLRSDESMPRRVSSASVSCPGRVVVMAISVKELRVGAASSVATIGACRRLTRARRRASW